MVIFLSGVLSGLGKEHSGNVDLQVLLTLPCMDTNYPQPW